MQTVHDHATTLEMLSPGQAFRFHFRDEAAMGLKAQFTHGFAWKSDLIPKMLILVLPRNWFGVARKQLQSNSGSSVLCVGSKTRRSIERGG